MVEKLLDLIIRLKKIFLKVEISGNEENEKFSELILVNADLNAHIIGLQNNVALLNKDHQEALAMLDELEEVIKKWES